MLFVLVVAIPVRERRFRRHVLGKPRYIAGLVCVLQGVGDLRKLSLLIALKHLKLRVHPVNQLLLLLVQRAPSLVRYVVLLVVDVEGQLVRLQDFLGLIPFQDHARDIRFKIANGLFGLLLIEIGLVVTLDLLQKSFFGDTCRKRVDIDTHVNGQRCQTLLSCLFITVLVLALVQVEDCLPLFEDNR